MHRVLVVDDDSALLRVIGFVLESDGFEVQTAENGATALEMVREEQPDVIILDLMMPVMDGRTFASKAREAGIGTPILVLSAFGAARAGAEMPVEDYLDKPFDPDELVEKVRHLTEGRAAMA